MHIVHKLLNLLVLLPLSLEVLHAQGESETFSNPVFAHDWPDPTIWQGDDSLYYTFSTAGTNYAKGLGKFLWSEDMVTWDTIPDYVWTSQTLSQLKQYGSSLWAPQVTRIGGRWLMYLTCYGTSSADPSIVVLTLDSETFPTSEGLHGPWSLDGVITSSKENHIIDTIDPFVTEDTITGRVWMFFGSTGRNYRVELAADGLSLSDSASFTHVAGLSLAEDTKRNKVFEGAYLYYRYGYWYYFVSSGMYSNYTYSLKVGRSPSLDGTFVSKSGDLMTEGHATTILSTNSDDKDFFGPGHCGEIFEDNDGHTYMYYHCHAKDVPITVAGYIPRALMLQQIYWDDEGWPYFEGGKPLAQEEWPNLEDGSFHNLPFISEEVTNESERAYTLTGLLVKVSSRGFYIIHKSDGTFRKMFIVGK